MDRSKLTSILPYIYLLIYALFIVFTNSSIFSSSFDPQKAQQRYFNSAYVKGDKADYILSDSQLYATEGFFLIQEGRDLKNITPGHPPLGKYLIGISTYIFGNPVWINFLFGLAVLLLIYLLTSQFFSQKIAFLTLIVFSFEPLFLPTLTKTMLDVYLLFFSLLSIYFYILWLKKDKFTHIFISQLSLGLAFSSKIFISSLPLLAALVLTTLLSGNFKRFINHLLAGAGVLIGFLVGHFSFFIHHPSLLDFASYQRFVLSWWVGSPQLSPGLVWDLIYRNRWHTWWGDGVVSVQSWWPGWPVFISLGLLSLPLSKISKNFDFKALPLYLWLLISLLLFSFEAVYPRHLLIILPAAYLLSLRFLSIIKAT